jgi:alkylation response protein AidB-like acyl-CoA dehydrogenase
VYFGLPDDALSLREGLREVLATACTPAVIRAAWDGSNSAALWRELGSFGLIGLLVPEDRGGLGLDALALSGAMEECGYAGVPGPLVETVAFLPGTELPADGSAVLTVTRPDGSARGLGTHVVDLDGVLRPLTGWLAVATVDPTRKAVQRDAVDVPAPPGPAHALATLGTAAFLLGLARRQVDLTVAYVKERKQFGVPVGSFQAIKHPLADAVVGTEFAWPAVLRAAESLSSGDRDARMHVSMAKALASDAAYKVSRVCLQAHGAMGYTVEYDLHLFAKRTWALAKDWGTADEHRAIVARELLGGTAP